MDIYGGVIMEKLPREKLIEDGVEALSDDELLAIMLGSGTKSLDVFSLSKNIIKEYGFKNLYQMSYKELAKIPGIKKAKACKLMVVFEIVKRMIKYENERIILKGSKEVYDYVKADYLLEPKEVLTILYLNSKLQVIKKDSIRDEKYTEIEIPFKRLIADSIKYDAYGIILIHNHPAGNPNPSIQDDISTEKIGNILKEMGILLLDHLIIADNKYYSYSDSRSMKSLLY